MPIKKSEKQELLKKLNLLLKKQSDFQQEINELEIQITKFHVDEPETNISGKPEYKEVKQVNFEVPKEKKGNKLLEELDKGVLPDFLATFQAFILDFSEVERLIRI